MGMIAAALIAVPGYLYLDWRIRCARKKGLHFVEDAKHQQTEFDETEHPKWHWLSGLSIALEALGPQFLEKAAAMGMTPEYLHRIASLASGGLDTLPHNGAVLTLLAVSHCSHKESYMDVCVTSCIIPVVISLLLSLVWGLFI